MAYVAAVRPDAVIHLAGRVGGIGANIAAPALFLRENLAIGVNILKAAFAAGVPRLINLGTSCMYPKDLDGVLSEDRLLTGPLEPTNEGYATAKLAVWKLMCAMRLARPNLAWVTLIPPNLYGPFDHFEPERSHLIAAAIAKIEGALATGQEAVEIWGDGTARREFLFAPDLAACLWWSLSRIRTLPETLNVGVGEDRSVDDYYAAVAASAGFRGRMTHDLNRPAGMRNKLLDSRRIHQMGWRAPTRLCEGLDRTLAFRRQMTP